MANYFQTGFTALQELAKMKQQELKVIEIPEPFEGQIAIAQDGTEAIYRNGEWISRDQDNNRRRVEAFGDCA